MSLETHIAGVSGNIPRPDRTILVFGATGQQGGAVTKALRARGWSVRALARRPDSAPCRALAALGVDVVAGDFADPASVRRAMTGVYGVFSVQPSSGQGAAYGVSDADEVRYGKTVADLAVELGVRHFVHTSVGVSGPGLTGMGHFDSKAEIEAHIRGLDLRSTILRPATFMEMLMLPGMGLDQGRFTFFIRPDQAGQIIAVEDIGRIAAAVFEDPDRYVGRSLDIAGDAVTGRELEQTLTHAAGRPIAYQRFSDALLAENAFLGRIATLFETGRLTGAADLAGLRQSFPGLLTFGDWLATTGKPLLEQALKADPGAVSLR